jgi:hypothetical protein
MVAKAERLRYCIENDVWLRRESACHYQFGHPCEYRPIDSISPKDRADKFKSHYIVVKPWTAAMTGVGEEQKVK